MKKVIIVINCIIYGGYSKRLQWIWCNRYISVYGTNRNNW